MPDKTEDSVGSSTAGGRIERLERWILELARRWEYVRPIYKPYVEGLENLPADGRFLLVGNHTAFASTEILLVPYEVYRQIGHKVRPLTDRHFGRMKGLQADVLEAAGAIIGTPDGTRELMRANEPILVFPGGAREISKGKDELYTLLWGDRAGFARLAVENNYPIVTAAVVGGDDVYKILTSRHGWWGRLNKAVAELTGARQDMTIQLMRGIGPTLVPRPQRLYARFSQPIETTMPDGASEEDWVAKVRDMAKSSLEADLADLQKIRSTDPFRHLAPWAWPSAVMPPAG
ncbi:lysophospholipid acyltransferase family protein [Mycobacterium sp. DL592]|uniref:lysophospholipid acyltransferase family protein n=1 Tax=Mycobacterium sp. DL592 TaxID=2675524 RepID=UPI00141F3B7A|nr:lysophospholipid acyltransferase family protein [Mycobacterium sp. DL592]